MAEDEFLLIFGGMVARNKSYYDNTTNANYSIFDKCEDYVNQVSEKNLEIDDALKACGEELRNDLWKYSLKRKKWY